MSRLKHWITNTWEWSQDRFATLRRRDRFLLVHIPKTAGTSLRRMLQQEYGPRLVYPGDTHLERLPHGWYPSGRELLRQYRSIPPHNVLVGHVAASFADLLPRPYRTVALLRDPVQRSLSLLNHWSAIKQVPVEELLADHNFVDSMLADFQTRTLGVDGVCDPMEVRTIDDRTLARAIERLDSMDFIGVTERFAESCRIFDARFGTRIAPLHRRDNVFRPAGRELSEYAPRLEPLLRRDRVLYEAAVARLTSDCR